jgi:hypothetical protein
LGKNIQKMKKLSKKSGKNQLKFKKLGRRKRLKKI